MLWQNMRHRMVSFKEIRERKLPLRNIPSLDLYLENCEEKICENQNLAERNNGIINLKFGIYS